MGPRLTLLEAPKGAEETCYVDTALGVAAVLRGAAACRARAAAYFDSDRHFIDTSLLAIDPQAGTFVFSKSDDAALNAMLLQAEKLTFVTSDNAVPVQFSCAKADTAQHEGREVFRAPLPSRVLRLQRRGYYRLPGEPTHLLLRCELSRTDGSPLKASVFDLSCGGLAAAVPAAEPLLERRAVYGCTLEVPSEGRIDSPVVIRRVTKIMLPNGLEGTRYGLKFVDLDERKMMGLQRYILERQRTRRARRTA